MRLHEYAAIASGFLNDLPPQIRAAEPKLLTLHFAGKPADAAGFSEIDPPTNDLGNTTAAVCETISGSANDNQAAGAHLQSMAVIGIDDEDEIITRTEVMHATDGTNEQATTNLYKEAFHAYANAHGTGDMDAAGNCDFRKADDTVIVQIPAGDNESNGSRIIVPDNHVCMLYGGQLKRFAVATDEGIKIRIVYVDAIDGESGMAAADRAINWLEFIVAAYQNIVEVPKGFMFEEGTKITFEHSSLVDAGEDYDLQLNFLIWKK